MSQQWQEPTAAGPAAGRQTRGKHAPRDYRKQTTIIMETMLTLSQANVPSCTTICLVVLLHTKYIPLHKDSPIYLRLDDICIVVALICLNPAFVDKAVLLA